MEFKNCVTWKEIIQQPCIWREEVEIDVYKRQVWGEAVKKKWIGVLIGIWIVAAICGTAYSNICLLYTSRCV